MRLTSHSNPSNTVLLRAPDGPGALQRAIVEKSLPQTTLEWTTLVKIASGELDVSRSQCARLIELGLVEMRSEVPALTQHGRLTLGLPE
jgi:hypothetical protein